MQLLSWAPVGKTLLVAADTTAPVGTQAITSPCAGGFQYRVCNNGTVTVFYAWSKTSGAAAAALAVIPTATSQDSYPLPPGAVEVVTAPADAYFSAITASGTASVFITPGRGL